MSDDQQDPTIPMPPKKRVRGKAKKKRAARTPRAAPDAYAAVASTEGMADDALAKLQAEIAGLKEKLADETSKRTEAETEAIRLAAAQGLLMQSDMQEFPTGKTVTVQRAAGYKRVGRDNGHDVLEPIWKDVELPVYAYRIDLPPCGGTDYKINGVPFYHGATYELDIDSLRTVKDIIYRCWKHDAEIHGSDENAYRPKKKPVLSARAYG